MFCQIRSELEVIAIFWEKNEDLYLNIDGCDRNRHPLAPLRFRKTRGSTLKIFCIKQAIFFVMPSILYRFEHITTSNVGIDSFAPMPKRAIGANVTGTAINRTFTIIFQSFR